MAKMNQRKTAPDIESLKPKKLLAPRAAEGMSAFTLYRGDDESGVSGLGIVLEGIVFSSGTCVIHWLTPAPSGSIAIWESFNQFEKVHILSHPSNDSVVTWESGEQTVY
jgi:hypothetical protein